jgi:hypothetical protein
MQSGLSCFQLLDHVRQSQADTYARPERSRTDLQERRGRSLLQVEERIDC